MPIAKHAAYEYRGWNIAFNVVKIVSCLNWKDGRISQPLFHYGGSLVSLAIIKSRICYQLGSAGKGWV